MRETQPFNPERDIKRSDLNLATRDVRGKEWFDVKLARDISICLPEKRALFDVSQRVVDQVVLETEQASEKMLTGLDTSRVLDNAAALFLLRPDLNPDIFNEAQFLGQPVLHFVRETFIKESEQAIKDRQTGIRFPRWRRSSGWGIIDFANYHIITQGTSLALELSAADKEDSIGQFQNLITTTSPFVKRNSYVESALETGAALKTIDPDIQLAVEPLFWREVRTLLSQTRNDRLDWDWYGGKRARREALKTNLIPYFRESRQATVLAKD